VREFLRYLLAAHARRRGALADILLDLLADLLDRLVDTREVLLEALEHLAMAVDEGLQPRDIVVLVLLELENLAAELARVRADGLGRLLGLHLRLANEKGRLPLRVLLRLLRELLGRHERIAQVGLDRPILVQVRLERDELLPEILVVRKDRLVLVRDGIQERVDFVGIETPHSLAELLLPDIERRDSHCSSLLSAASGPV